MAEAWAHDERDGFGAGDEMVEVLRRRLVRLALDVHDGPMQELVAAGYALSSLRQRLDNTAAESRLVEAALAQIHERLALAEQGLRSTISSMDHGIEQLTLVEMVVAVVEAAKTETAAQVKLSITGEDEATSDSQRIALTRVLRESLTNAIRHGRPQSIEVRLQGDPHALLLQVRDDGCGFDTATATASRGDGSQLGINGMYQRLRLLGGTLSIESRPGGPTIVTAHLDRWPAL